MRRVAVNPVYWPLPPDKEIIWRQLDTQFYSYNPHAVRGGLGGLTSPTERLEIILSHHALLVKAKDLTTFLESCPPEGLKDNYKVIVDAIFTCEKEQSWELRTMRKADYPNESTAVFKLLAPDGPLISLGLKLMDDHNYLLEFPCEWLPIQFRKKFGEEAPPPYFLNKMKVTQSFGGKGPIKHLLLNPFEYYMVSFAALNVIVVNTGKTMDYLNGWASLQDTLYTNILEEYLGYYFPSTGAGVPCHFNYNYNGAQQAQEAVFMANSLLRQQQPKQKFGVNTPPLATPDDQASTLPTLFRSNILQDQAGASNTRENIFLSTHPSAYKEVWRSETILQVFMELWMSGYRESLDVKFSSSSPMLYGGLPSVDVVKSIRMLVRYLHYFLNCVNSHKMHPMEEIKRSAYPVFQRRMYTFLRYLFQHWPLDNSFRIVYETWLSYIQPWRYTSMDRSRVSNQVRDAQDIIIDRKWLAFVQDNILFYSKLYSQMLIRLERVDLTATKNALMFYRLAKVYTVQESFKQMLQEIENGIQLYDRHLAAVSASNAQAIIGNDANSRSVLRSPQVATYSTPATQKVSTIGKFFGGQISPILGSPLKSPGLPHSTGLSASSAGFEFSSASNSAKYTHLKQMMKDCEDAEFIYEAIFSVDNIRKMKSLIAASTEAGEHLHAEADKLMGKNTKTTSLISNFVLSLFSDTAYDYQTSQAAAAEKYKAVNQLEFARNQFSKFYEIPIPESKYATATENGSAHKAQSYGSFNFSGNATSGSSSVIPSDNSSSFKKAYLPDGIVFDNDLIPHGNPDVALIRGDESGIAVQFLHQLEDKIEKYYFDSSLGAKYLRAVVAEPTEYIVSTRIEGPGGRRTIKTMRYLQPRISLRFLGSHTALAWILMIVIFCNLMGLGWTGGFLKLLFLYFMFLTFRATSEPVNKLEELRQLRLMYHTEGPAAAANSANPALYK